MPEVIRVYDSEHLLSTSECEYGSWGFSQFNPVQSAIVSAKLYDQGNNIAIAAATSCGKTVMAEMFMSHDVRSKGGKAIYVGPLKALAKEKEQDWTQEAHHFSDLNISICTGDYRLTQKRVKELDAADVIIMTPEMLASRARNEHSEKSHFLRSTNCLVFDESHLLTVPSRGDHIEVALMKMVEINPEVRIVFLSATMPNVDEICQWLCKLTNRDTYYLESSYRPCPLNVHYQCYYDGDRKYEDVEAQKVGTALGIIEYYHDDKFLVFVHTKRTGKMMMEHLKRHGIDSEFHNADLGLTARLKLEKKFKEDPKFRVLVATSTLAWGCYKHGSRVVMSDGSLKNVEFVQAGDRLLSPVEGAFVPKKVVKAKSFHKESGYFIKLECGDTMIVSPDHIFFAAIQRDSPNWVEVSQLREGDFVATPSDLNLWGADIPIDRFWYLLGLSFGDGCLCDCGIHADGSQKALYDLCLGVRDDFCNFVVHTFNEEFDTSFEAKDDINGIPHLTTKRRDVVDAFLQFLPLGRKTGEQDIPMELFKDQRRVRSFVRGLFDADGGVEYHNKSNSSVGLSNISKKVIESVRTILLGFGIRSSFGRKRMKDVVINGRYQPPVRKWSYRLRVFGRENLAKFKSCIGFSHVQKNMELEKFLGTKSKGGEKDLVPARQLLVDHIEINGLTGNDFRRITSVDLWNPLHKQDCLRKTLRKLLDNTKIKTQLNDLVDSPIYWSRVCEIRPCPGTEFRELELEEPHAYIGNGVISHNCNLPARRVIVTGVHRGLSWVENYDIQQMIGRAGRPAYDPQGDAYILVPENTKNETIAKLRKKSKIESQLLSYVGTEEKPHYKVLAFHLVSEIYSGNITTKDGFHEWFRKSLAHYQDQSFDDKLIDVVIDQLVACYAITVENGEYKATNIGKVASIFYFSPFDVSDLRRNFKHLFENGREKDDHAVSMALGNIDSFRWGITSRDERDQMGPFSSLIKRKFGEYFYTDSVLKAGYAYHNMLNGKYNVPAFAALQAGLRVDSDRTLQVLKALDSMSARWGQQEYFKVLQKRLTYGVTSNLIDLCQIPDVGKARAERLWAAGIRSLDDFANTDAGTLSKVMKVTAKAANTALSEAKSLQVKKSVE